MNTKKTKRQLIDELIDKKRELEKKIVEFTGKNKRFKVKILKVKLMLLNQKWRTMIIEMESMNDPIF